MMYSWKNLYVTIKRPTTYVVFSPCGGLDRERMLLSPCTGAASPPLSRRPSIRPVEGRRSAGGLDVGLAVGLADR